MLKLARWRCQKCESRRGLDVHHTTYERLGHEWDSDLQVLCRDCHTKLHVKQIELSPSSVYLKLASEALREEPFHSIADLEEAVRAKCKTLNIEFDWQASNRALNLLSGTNRLSKPLPTTRQEFIAEQGRPLTTQESRECLLRLGIEFGDRKIPTAPWGFDDGRPVDDDEIAYEHDRY